jgi:hypothetical protein
MLSDSIISINISQLFGINRDFPIQPAFLGNSTKHIDSNN